jgi:hypothetical protein
MSLRDILTLLAGATAAQGKLIQSDYYHWLLTEMFEEVSRETY